MNAFWTALDLAFASEIAGLRPADPAATQAAAEADRDKWEAEQAEMRNGGLGDAA